MVGIIEPPYGVPRGKVGRFLRDAALHRILLLRGARSKAPRAVPRSEKKVFPDDVLKRFSHSRPELGYRDVHQPRPAGILQGPSLSGPANAAALSPGGWP